MDSQSATIETPLAELHRAAGARMGSWFGCALPDEFGDWREEYRFAQESVALVDKNYRASLEFTGPDRVRYLNAILTNNIKDLKEKHGNVSLFLNPQGHIQAEIETYAMADKLFCVSYAMIREKLVAGLEKYIIMDDVTLTDRTQLYATVGLEGPKAGEVVKEVSGVDLQDLNELETREVSVGGISCGLVKRSLDGVNGGEFLALREEAEALWKMLADAARKHSGGPMGYTALNAVRLEQGVPWFGYDFGEKQIPHEAGLQDSHISYTKGCYTGQEIVERVRSRGQVNRSRVSLKFDTPELPAANTPLLVEGKEFGTVTRSAFSPARNAFIGMGYVRREKAAAGSVLEVAGGTATVLALSK
ncbi:MAG TPA: glycine cleavage T C-terminal barrel domain-containing protein [Candidatus Acidoferrum sp.]